MEEQIPVKTKSKKVIGLIILILLVIIWSMLYLYFNSPNQVVNKYVNSFNKGEFEKLTNFYSDFMIEEELSRDEVLKSLKDVAENFRQPVIKIIKDERKNQVLMNFGYDKNELKDKNKILIPVEYIDGSINYSEVLTLYKNNDTKKWQTSFPYPMEYIIVSAPIGTTIFVDDKEQTQIGLDREVQLGPFLPGKHIVEMKFFRNIKPPYIKELYLLEEVVMASPHETTTITIETIEGAEVIFDKILLLEHTGIITLENVLEGPHLISVNYNEDMVRPINEELIVVKDETNFTYKDFTPQPAFLEMINDMIYRYKDATFNAYTNYNKTKNDPLKDIVSLVTEDKLKTDLKFYYNSDSNIVEHSNGYIDNMYFSIKSPDTIHVGVFEEWFVKYKAINGNFVHNGKTEIETKTIFSVRYIFVKEGDVWKIDAAANDAIDKRYLKSNGQWMLYK